MSNETNPYRRLAYIKAISHESINVEPRIPWHVVLGVSPTASIWEAIGALAAIVSSLHLPRNRILLPLAIEAFEMAQAEILNVCVSD